MKTQYTTFPIDPDTGAPRVAPELGVKFEVTADDTTKSRDAARRRADQIARAHRWLDRGVREWCVLEP